MMYCVRLNGHMVMMLSSPTWTTCQQKSGVVLTNASELAAATLSENSILVSYNNFYGSSAGASHQYGIALDKIRRAVREDLSGPHPSTI
jgi:hypothetical protein